jgi:heme exporter protein C
MNRSGVAYSMLLVATMATFAYVIPFIFLNTPAAQLAAGGLAQKIFYFHVPAAYAMYLSGLVCLAASAAYLLSPSDRRDALAQAAAECAVLFGAMVLTSGPLWAKKAWGVYWTWEPRLTTSLLSVLVYLAVVVLRAFSGSGAAARRFAAALGVLGTLNLPIIHLSVTTWGGHHPTVVGRGGGGLGSAAMQQALLGGLLAMTLLCILLIWARTGVLVLRASVARLEQRAAAADLGAGG